MRARRSVPLPLLSPCSSITQPAMVRSGPDEAMPSRTWRWRYFSVSSLLLVLVLVLGTSACSTRIGSSGGQTATAQPVTLTIFADSSLKAAFTQLEIQYPTWQKLRNIHSTVTFSNNFAGSDALAGQITQGAAADIFAADDNTHMNVAVSGGEIASSQVQVFANNRLVVIVPTDNPANIQSLQDLAKPGVKIVLAEKTAPAGQNALQFLMQASADSSFGSSYQTNVLHNVVSYQADVASVVAQVALGQADAGIVYTTDAAADAATLSTLTIPDNLNVIASYPIAPIKSSKSLTTAQQFITFVTSSNGQSILGTYGFLSSSPASS